MPKDKNLLGTEKLTLSTNPHVVAALARLVRTGYYGKNPAEAAERVVARTLEEWESSGRIPSTPEVNDGGDDEERE